MVSTFTICTSLSLFCHSSLSLGPDLTVKRGIFWTACFVRGSQASDILGYTYNTISQNNWNLLLLRSSLGYQIKIRIVSKCLSKEFLPIMKATQNPFICLSKSCLVFICTNVGISACQSRKEWRCIPISPLGCSLCCSMWIILFRISAWGAESCSWIYPP